MAPHRRIELRTRVAASLDLQSGQQSSLRAQSECARSGLRLQWKDFICFLPDQCRPAGKQFLAHVAGESAAHGPGAKIKAETKEKRKAKTHLTQRRQGAKEKAKVGKRKLGSNLKLET
jgi:hypothetical protein